MNTGILPVLVLSLAIAALALTITKAEVSEPLRIAVTNRSAWLGKLIHCPYCTSHWLALGAVALYQPVFVYSNFYLLDLTVSLFAIVSLAMFFAGAIFKIVAGMHMPDPDDEIQPVTS